MFFQVDAKTRRRARSPHELAMVNLLLVNLVMLIVLLASSFAQAGSSLAEYKIVGVMVPLGISLAIVAFTFATAGKEVTGRPWFVTAHWRLSASRYKILLIAYVAGAALIGLGWLFSQGQKDPRMEELMFIALQRVAVAPLLISVMVVVMLESGSLYQVDRGEVPDGLIRRFPPPADLPGSDTELQTDTRPC